MKDLKRYISEGFFDNIGVNPYKEWLDGLTIYPATEDYGCHAKFSRGKYCVREFSWDIKRCGDTQILFAGMHFKENFTIDISKIHEILSLPRHPSNAIHVSYICSYRNKTYDITIKQGQGYGNMKDRKSISFSYNSKTDTIYNIRTNF